MRNRRTMGFTILLAISFLTAVACSHWNKKSNPDFPSRQPNSGLSQLAPQLLQVNFRNWKVQVGNAWNEMIHMTEQLQCVRDICGPERSNYSQTDAAWDELIPHQIYKPGSPEYNMIDSVLRQNIQLEIEDYRKLKAEVLALQRHPDKISPQLLHFHNLKNAMNKEFLQLLNHRIVKGRFSSYSSFVNPTRDEWKEIGVTGARLEFLDELTKAGFVSTLAEIFDRWSWSYEHFMKTEFPNIEFERSESYLAERCINQIENFKERIQIPAHIPFGTECESIQKNPMHPINRTELLESYRGLWFFNRLLNPKFVRISERYPLDLKKEIEELLNSNDFAILEKFETFETEQKKKDEILDKCHHKIRQNLFFSGSDLKVRQIQKHIPRLMELTPAVAGLENPEHIDHFKKQLARLTFSTPHSRSRSLQFILRNLESNIEVNGLVKNEPVVPIINGLFFVMSDREELEFDKDNHPVNLFADLEETCDELQLEALSDHVYTSSGSVYLSWLSVQKPEYGVGIAAHEIGHFVQRVILDMNLKHNLANLQNYQKTGQPTRLPFNGASLIDHLDKRLPYCHASPQQKKSEKVTQYVDEDFADHFAGLLLKEFSKEAPWVRNFGCSLVQEQNGFYMIDRVNHPDARHSRNAFRILNIENTWRDGKLPKSCESFQARALACKAPH